MWLVAGTFVNAHAGPDSAWITGLLAAIGALICTGWWPRWRWPVAALAMFCAGSVLARGAELRTRVPDPLALLIATPGSRPVTVRGVVEPQIRWSTDGTRVRAGLRVEAVRVDDAWAPLSGRVWWSWYRPNGSLEAGTRVQVAGRLRAVRGFVNPGLFDYGRYLRRRGYHSQLSAHGSDAVTVLGRGHLPLRQAAVGAVRRHLSAVVQRIPASEDGRGFLLAVLGGDRRWVSAELREAGQLTGTYHLLSISGLHVGIVAAGVLLAARAAGLRRRWTTVVAIGFIAAYATLTGGAVPVVRAALMFSLALIMLRWRRPPDGLSIIAVVAAAVLLFDPLAFHAAGCQLSFAAVAALLVVYRPLSRHLYDWVAARVEPPWRWPVLAVAHAFLVPAIVHLAIAPILLWHFQQLPVVSVPANTLATPLLGVVLLTGALAAAGLSIHPVVGAVPAWLAAGATEMLLGWIKLMARLAATVTGVATVPPLPVLAAYAVALLSAWFLLRYRPLWRAGTVAASLVLLNFAPARPAPRALEITALDVGQADATVLRFPTGEVMLVDGGRRSRTFDTGTAIVLPYLLRHGIRRVDWLVATHGHNDHLGGLISVLDALPVGEIWTNGSAHDTWTTRTFGARAVRSGRPVVQVQRGHTLRVGDHVDVRVLNPTAVPRTGTSNDENDNSIVIRIDYAGVAVLLAADASGTLPDAIAAGAPWPERVVLKAPHHGFPRPGTGPALAALRPTLAWASLGAVWPPRWPVPGLHGAQATRRTDRHGGVRIRIEPTGAITVRPTIGEPQAWPEKAENHRLATVQTRTLRSTGVGAGH